MSCVQNNEWIKKYYKTTKGKTCRAQWESDNKIYRNKYKRNKRLTDINYKLRTSLRSRLNAALKHEYKYGSAVKDLGCAIHELKEYLESMFQEGMTWENYGRTGWHIDHIIPLCRFDLTDYEQLKKACHYTNLQPLWASENLSKAISVKDQ